MGPLSIRITIACEAFEFGELEGDKNSVRPPQKIAEIRITLEESIKPTVIVLLMPRITDRLESNSRPKPKKISTAMFIQVDETSESIVG